MSFTIYGIRLRGEPEVRYVGMTYKPIARRLKEHIWVISVPNLSAWICANQSAVEIFAIASVEDRAEARATEKVVIALCSRLNHRLFNRTHVDPSLRWDSSPVVAA